MTFPLKWTGGKGPIADWIVSQLPPHSNYCEPFAGGLAVLLAKEPEGVSEVVNDLNKNLSLFWRVLRDPDLFRRFMRIVEATPFSESVWEEANETLRLENDPDEPYEQSEYVAAAFFVKCRQSLAGRMKSFASVSTSRRRRGMNEQVSAWLTAIEGLPAVHERLKRVLVLNRDALKVIRDFDQPDTVQYLDPPYPHSTRASTDLYEHELSDDQHRELLATVLTLKHAKVAISSYPNAMYDYTLVGWRRLDKDVANHTAGGKTKRRMCESLYVNW